MTFVEKPKQPYPPPGQDPPPTPGCFGNQISHQSENPWRKQNPCNNSANRSYLSWSRQNKTMTSKPFKPLTCFYCRRFIPECSVSLLSNMSDPTPTKILRDIGASQSKILRNTGASQSLLLSDTLSFSEESSVGASVLIREINC